MNDFMIFKKNKTRAYKNSVKFLLILLLVFHAVNNIYLLHKNILPEGKDSYAHIMSYLNFSSILMNKSGSLFYETGRSFFYNFFLAVFDYPIFFYFSAFLVNSVFGNFILNSINFTATLFFLLLLISVYKIGSLHNLKTGIFSAIICSFYPLIFISSRHFSLEIPVAAMVCLSVWILLKTNFFLNRTYSILLGIVLVLGVLTKQSFLIYVLGPLSIILAGALLYYRQDKKRKRIINIIYVFILLIIFSFYFYARINVIANIATRIKFNGAVSGVSIFGIDHLTYYMKSILKSLGGVFALLFIFSLSRLDRFNWPLRFLLIAWLILPFLLLTFLRIKYAEYSIAYLPAVAIISSAAVLSIKNSKFRKTIITIIMIWAMFNFFNISYGNVKSFYATYYSKNPYGEIVKVDDSNPKGMNFEGKKLDDLLIKLGNQNKIIGIFYDQTELQFPSYFVRLFSVKTEKKAQVIDFIFRPPVFFKNMDKFDILIFVSRSAESWVGEKTFFELEQDLNKQNLHVYDFSKYPVKELIDLKKQFCLKYSVKFKTETDKPQEENIFIYERDR